MIKFTLEFVNTSLNCYRIAVTTNDTCFKRNTYDFFSSTKNLIPFYWCCTKRIPCLCNSRNCMTTKSSFEINILFMRFIIASIEFDRNNFIWRQNTSLLFSCFWICKNTFLTANTKRIEPLRNFLCKFRCNDNEWSIIHKTVPIDNIAESVNISIEKSTFDKKKTRICISCCCFIRFCSVNAIDIRMHHTESDF